MQKSCRFLGTGLSEKAQATIPGGIDLFAGPWVLEMDGLSCIEACIQACGHSSGN